MEKIKYYIEKYKIIVSISILILIIGFCTIYIFLNKPNKEDIVKTVEVKKDQREKEEIKKLEKIKVDIKGFVKEPGVYEMDIDSRVIDVINKSGGLKEEANT